MNQHRRPGATLLGTALVLARWLVDVAARYRKAVWAFLIPAAGQLVPVLVSGRLPTKAELIAALGISLATAFGVAKATNRASS